jgi:hypothetical protein
MDWAVKESKSLEYHEYLFLQDLSCSNLQVATAESITFFIYPLIPSLVIQCFTAMQHKK